MICIVLYCHQTAAASQVDAWCAPLKVDRMIDVASVVDGDTVRLSSGQSVRILGFNAPEIRSKEGGAEPYSYSSQQLLESWIEVHKGNLGLVFDRDKEDRYGRLLAHLTDGHGIPYAWDALAKGQAYAIAVSPNIKTAGCFFDKERDARQKQLGIWEKNVSVNQVKQSGFGLLRGKVSEVRKTKKAWWLDLSNVSIRMDVKSIDPNIAESLVGKTVEIRGWFRANRDQQSDRQPWFLTVDNEHMWTLIP